MLLVSRVVASAIIERLPARGIEEALAWEISSHESWQWGCLDEEQASSGFVLTLITDACRSSRTFR
jgi:hypothetical protein